MRLGEVIDLLHRARDRYRSLELEIREGESLSLGVEAFRQASRRELDRRPPGSFTFVEFGSAPPAPDREAQDWFEGRAHIWLESPTRWRIEQHHSNLGPDGLPIEGPGAQRETVTIRNGRWEWSTTNGHRDNQYEGIQLYEEIWDPALLVAELWLEPPDEIEFLGRRAVRVQARPRPTERAGGEVFLLLEEGDSHEMIVDAELGIVLRLVSMIDGQPFEITEVTDLRADEPIDAAVFALPDREGTDEPR